MEVKREERRFGDKRAVGGQPFVVSPAGQSHVSHMGTAPHTSRPDSATFASTTTALLPLTSLAPPVRRSNVEMASKAAYRRVRTSPE